MPEVDTRPLDTARKLAEAGDLDGAATIFAELAADPAEPDRAQAAVGLAVVLEESGDVPGARTAARTALGTGHPEFAAQAACLLAGSFEREDLIDQARAAWQAALGVGNPAYVPLAHMALARLATGDQEAEEALRAALATADPEIASRAAQRLAEVFLEEGEAGEAAEVLLEALSVPEVADVPRLRVMLGIAHLELACAEFSAAIEERRRRRDQRAGHRASGAHAPAQGPRRGRRAGVALRPGEHRRGPRRRGPPPARPRRLSPVRARALEHDARTRRGPALSTGEWISPSNGRLNHAEGSRPQSRPRQRPSAWARLIATMPPQARSSPRVPALSAAMAVSGMPRPIEPSAIGTEPLPPLRGGEGERVGLGSGGVHLGSHAAGDALVEPLDERLDQSGLVVRAEVPAGLDGGPHVLANILVVRHSPILHASRVTGISR